MIIIGVSLVLISLALYFYIKSIVDSFSIDLSIDDVNLKDLSFKSLDVGKGYIEVKLKFVVKFFGISSIGFSNLNLKAYYNDVLVASSTNSVDNKRQVTVFEGINNVVYHSFNIQVNKSSIELAYNIKSKGNYTIDYDLSFKTLGFDFSYKGKYKNS